jgi:hypothetical protein
MHEVHVQLVRPRCLVKMSIALPIAYKQQEYILVVFNCLAFVALQGRSLLRLPNRDLFCTQYGSVSAPDTHE